MKKKLFIAIIIIIPFMLYPVSILTCSRVQHFELSRFISPEVCGGCHDTIYGQWKNSMHNLSHNDEIYRSIAFYMLKGLTDVDEIKEAESCVKCHTPVGFFTGFPTTLSDERDAKKIPEIAKLGIQCDFCHSATGAYRIYNAQIELDPGHGDANPGIKRGPYKNSNSDFHKTVFSKFHTESQICGVCHDVRHVVYGTKLETTYEEWENGPYNSGDPLKAIQCQGCHMHQRPGFPSTGSTSRPKNPGSAAVGAPGRDHVFTHYFVGGNRVIPAQNRDSLKSQMAEDRLKNAAEISIDDNNIKEGKIIITIKNTGAGHYIPTGLTDVRQMWLEIIVKNEKGKIFYQSGQLDGNGYLGNDAIIYNTVFGDGKGKAVSNIAKAKEILKDRRIPPLKSLNETVKIPAVYGKAINIEARLLYRSASQELVDKVMGKGKIKLPVTVMCEVKREIKL